MTADRITNRYHRPVISHPNGAVVHDGDCYVFAARTHICTCGLLHMLVRIDHVEALRLYPKFEDEYAVHLAALSALNNQEIAP